MNEESTLYALSLSLSIVENIFSSRSQMICPQCSFVAWVPHRCATQHCSSARSFAILECLGGSTRKYQAQSSHPHHRYITTIYIYYIQFSNVLRIPSAAVFLHVDKCPHVRPRLPRQLGPCRLTHFPAFASEVNLANLYFLSLFCSLFPTVHLFHDKGSSLSSLHFSKWLKVVDSQGFSNSAIQTALKLRWVVSIALNSLHF